MRSAPLVIQGSELVAATAREPQGSQRAVPGAGRPQLEPPTGEPCDHGLGRSRGGWTSKLHLACEQGQKVLAIVVTAGQRGEPPQFPVVLDHIRVPRLGSGRPRTRPVRVLADKAYSSRANRELLARRGIKAVVPVKNDQVANRKKKGTSGGREYGFG